MSDEKRRLVLFVLLSFVFMTGMPVLMEKMGWVAPPPAADKPKPEAKGDLADDAAKAQNEGLTLPENVFAEDRKPGAVDAPAAIEKARVEPVEPAELVLGPKDFKAPEGYLLQLQLTQQGAGVVAIFATNYEAEWKDRKNLHEPMALLVRDRESPPSFVIDLIPPDSLDPDDRDNPVVAAEKAADRAQYSLDGVLWEVERDESGRIVREAPPKVPGGPIGQEIRFRTAVDKVGPAVTKRFILHPGEPAFELIVEMDVRGEPVPVAYRLMGPHGIPIEGEWYTSTFRDLVVGQREENGGITLLKASDSSAIAKTKPEDLPRYAQRPLAFAGVENQYFAVLVEPIPDPDGPKDGWVTSTSPALIHDNSENHQKADISFELTTKPELVSPGHPEIHTYRIFAGPKIIDVLKPYGAEELASYRRGWQFPVIGQIASMLSKNVIAPMLVKIHALTRQVGGGKGSYGIAIILLTVTVRMMLFPLGRKAAIAAKKMQALQPQLSEIREKFKGENERILKEQQALYRRNNVSMLGGCLPAMIQLPIFIGLWQTLNNSVALRHASFLWIQNLAAPDMLFKFPMNVPYLGDYFNVLPFVVVGLMLIQNKLFMPPATTPEAEMQQKMMKYMMVFMAFMFYKVPSGLGLYFITSSLWAICERLLLPKVMHVQAPVASDDDEIDGGKGGPGGNGPRPTRPGGGGGWLSKKLEALLEEAAKEKTFRNDANGGGKSVNGGGTGGSRGGDRGTGPGKSRSRPRRR